jgi:hypothetical protein
VHDLGCPLIGEEQGARVQLGHREQLEFERGDDAVVAAPASDRPEQVGLVVVVDPAELAVGRHDLDGGEGVRLQAVLAAEPAHAAAQRVARDADVARGTGQRGEAGLRGGVRDSRPADARADARSTRLDVDVDVLQRVGAQQQGLLEPVDRAGVVARGLRGDPKPALGCVADRRGHVVGVRHADEGCGPLVVGEVEGLARGVPAVVALDEDAAMDA